MVVLVALIFVPLESPEAARLVAGNDVLARNDAAARITNMLKYRLILMLKPPKHALELWHTPLS